MGWSDKYKKSINCDNPRGFSQRAHCRGRKKKMKEAKDHEVSMAQSQLDKTIDNAKKLKKKLGTKEKNIPAWVQAKVTDTDHNMDAAASYSEEKGGRVKKIVKQLRKSVEMHKSQADYLDKLDEEGLRDWFGKSKSKDGKRGWVNVVTGDSCASDKPGEGVPKCVSSSKRASMSKNERLAAAAAKRREDPGQQQKSGAAKPTMVKTDRKVRSEEVEVNEAKDKPGKGGGKKDACYHKVKSRYSVWPSAYASGALVKCRKKGAANWGNSTKKEGMEEFYNLPELTEMQIKVLQKQGYDVEIVDEACWKGYEKKGMKTMFGKRYPNCVKKEEVEVSEAVGGAGTLVRQGIKLGGKKGGRAVQKGTTAATQAGRQAAAKAKQGSPEAGPAEKKGAAIGGTLGAIGGALIPDGPAMVAGEIAGGIAGSKIGGAIGKKFDKKPATTSEAALTLPAVGTAAALGAVGGLASGAAGILGAKAMKKMTDKKKKEEPQVEEGLSLLKKRSPEEIERLKKERAIKDREKKIKTYAALMKHTKDKNSDVAVKTEEVELEEGFRAPSQYGNVYIVTFVWRGKYTYLKMFFPQVRKPTREEVKTAIDKVYPGARLSAYTETSVGQGDSYFNAGSGGDTYSKFDEEVELEEGTPAWQRKEGKNPEGGLNKAGVASYRRANPGSKLQTAVTTKPSKLKKGSKASKRRKSFCARMKGMKKRLTSAKTARDPDSRINKSLRKWNC